MGIEEQGREDTGRRVGQCDSRHNGEETFQEGHVGLRPSGAKAYRLG